MWDTLADAVEDGPHPFDVDRYALVAAVRGGDTLHGIGSVERYRAALMALQIRGERYLDEGPGMGANLEVFPPTGDSPPGSWLRAELTAGWALHHAEGDLPTSVTVGAGIGADTLEVGASEGRVYPLARVRGVVFFAETTTGSLILESLPVIHSSAELVQHEHRVEIPIGVDLLEVGPRAALTFRHGGQPERLFVEHTLGVFVGVGLR